MYSDVEKAFDNGMRYAWNMVGDLFNMPPTERVDALGYSEVNEIVWDCDPVEVKTKMLDWKSKEVGMLPYTIEDGRMTIDLSDYKGKYKWFSVQIKEAD